MKHNKNMNVPIRIPGEREPPLHFAGREPELRAYGDKLASLCETGHTDGLMLTIGVQGAGKTQLGRKFAKDVSGSKVNGYKVSTLVIPPEALSDPVTLFKMMARAIGEKPRGDKIAQLDDRVSNTLSGLLYESVETGLWENKALVLVVDELQRIADIGMETLCVLHDNDSKCPVLLLGFGLQHTPDRLASPSQGGGISRIAEPATLRPLDHDTTIEAFAKNLAAVGHVKVPDESLDALAQASYGFPQHINGYLEGAHKALTLHGHLDDKSLAEALDHGNKRRIVYYNRRLSAAHSRKPLMAVVAEMNRVGADRLEYHDAKDALIKAGFGQQELDDAIQHGR